jgi:hypothetical protein
MPKKQLLKKSEIAAVSKGHPAKTVSSGYNQGVPG